MKLWQRAFTYALTVFIALSFATTALAQSDKKWGSIREELKTKALQDAWEEGRQLRDNKTWDQARVQFEAVHRDSKNPRVLHNIAICWKELGYYAQALGAWEKQLANRDKLPRDEAKRAEGAIKIVRKFVTTLELSSNQTGAVLLIKGIEIGKTPFLGTIPIDVGANKIELRKSGFVTIMRTEDVATGTPLKLELNMVPGDKKGTVSISISGADQATIFMDGAELGQAPFKGDVPIGTRTFEARAKGYVTAIQKSEIAFGKELNITISMVKQLKEGKVRVKTDHEDAVISIDGVVKGKGTWEGVLPEGGHALLVTKPGFQDHESDIAVATDQERIIDVVLDDDMTAHWVYWAVTGVLVAAGAGVTSYFVLRPSDDPIVSGTLKNGTIETSFGIGVTLPVFSF